MFKLESTSNINVGATLRSIRENKGMSQKEVVDQLPYTCYLSKIEHNKCHLAFNTMLDILVILNVSMDEFIQQGNSFIFQTFQHFQEQMMNSGFRITKHELLYHISKLKEHLQQQSSKEPVASLELMYCKMKCFYYLNFESDQTDAQKYVEKIMLHLFSVQYNYLIQDIELAVIAFAFCSYEEAQIIISKARFVLEQTKTTYQHELNTRFLLAYIKNMLKHNRLSFIPHRLEVLEKQLATYPSAKFRAEFKLLKGFTLQKLAEQQDSMSPGGIQLMNEGLKLAKLNHEMLLFAKWSKICRTYFNLV